LLRNGEMDKQAAAADSDQFELPTD
jgi:hypothetical protein